MTERRSERIKKQKEDLQAQIEFRRKKEEERDGYKLYLGKYVLRFLNTNNKEAKGWHEDNIYVGSCGQYHESIPYTAWVKIPEKLRGKCRDEACISTDKIHRNIGDDKNRHKCIHMECFVSMIEGYHYCGYREIEPNIEKEENMTIIEVKNEKESEFRLLRNRKKDMIVAVKINEQYHQEATEKNLRVRSTGDNNEFYVEYYNFLNRILDKEYDMNQW